MTPKLPFQEVADLIWPPKFDFRAAGKAKMTPKFDARGGRKGKTDPQIALPGGRHPNLTPQIISSTRSRVKNRGHFSFHGIQRSNLVPQIWESRRVRIKNGAHFSCSGDRARKATRKCVAVGHSEERSRPHFDTSKSKITLLEMTPYPSLHSATKNYLQEDEFLLVAKSSCPQKGIPFLIALSFTILDHLPNQQKSQLFFLIPTASSKNPLKIYRITIRYTSDLSLFHSCSCKDFNTQSEAIVWRRDS